MSAEHGGDDAGLAPVSLPLAGTPSAPSRMDQVIGRLQAVTGTLRDALHGPWQRERQRIRGEFWAQGLLPLLMKARNGTGWTAQ